MGLPTLERAVHWRREEDRVRRLVEYVEDFFRKGSAWQVMRVAGGGRRAFKEVMENYVLFKEVLFPLLREGGTLVEVCSGSTALLSLMTFLWTRARAYAIDLEKPSRRIREFLGPRFTYIQADIFSFNVRSLEGERPLVVAGLHCCGKLALRTVEMGETLGAYHIVVVPCCVDRKEAEKVIGREFRTYEDWVEAIRLSSTYRSQVVQLEGMPTNANLVVVFEKGA